MSAQSGVRVSSGLKECFEDANASDSNICYIKTQIGADKTEWEVIDRGEKTGTIESDFEQIQEVLEITSTCNVLFKRQGQAKWIVIAWTPPNAHPRSKMLYASSREGLKSGLGRENFDDDFQLSAKDECTYDSYLGKNTTVEQNKDLHTWQETNRMKANIETAPTQVKAAVMHTLALRISDAANSGLEKFASGSANFLLLYLEEGSEIMDVAQCGNIDINDLQKHLGKDPRFVLFRYVHTHSGEQRTSILQLYFCPDEARPKLKMFYSATVANVSELCDQFGIKVDRKLETDGLSKDKSRGPQNWKQLVEDDLYPPRTENVKFAKPAARGRRGRSRLHGIKK